MFEQFATKARWHKVFHEVFIKIYFLLLIRVLSDFAVWKICHEGTKAQSVSRSFY